MILVSAKTTAYFKEKDPDETILAIYARPMMVEDAKRDNQKIYAAHPMFMFQSLLYQFTFPTLFPSKKFVSPNFMVGKPKQNSSQMSCVCYLSPCIHKTPQETPHESQLKQTSRSQLNGNDSAQEQRQMALWVEPSKHC